MADPIRNYQQARRRLDEATAHADELTRRVRYIAVLLERWDTVEVRNIEFDGPSDTTMPIDAHEWPTIEEIASALSQWHRAAAGVTRTWRAIPEEDRIGLQPPPDGVQSVAAGRPAATG